MYDLVLKNTSVITMDKKCSAANWVAVENGKIRAVGTGNAPQEAKQVVDLAGKAVIPGLWDSHMHLLDYGFYLTSVNMEGIGSVQEALDRIEAYVKNMPVDQEWLFGMGYLAGFVKEQRFPYATELDKVTYGHKIILYSPTMHALALNTAAMEVVQIPDDIDGVEKIDGKQTGVYLSDCCSILASGRVHEMLPTNMLLSTMKVAINQSVKMGCTSIQALMGIGNAPTPTKVLMDHIKEMPISIYIWNQIWEADKVVEMGLPRIGGCLNLDGASFEHTGAMFDGYTDAPHLRGMLYYTDEQVYKFISEAHKAGLACTMHAVGERAIEQILWTYKRVFAEQGRKDIRHRIEHLCFPTEEQIKMAIEMDIILSMQPSFSYYWDKKDESPFKMVVGDRVDRMDPYNRIIEMGGIVCGGSDAPVTPVQPWTYIAHSVRGSNPVRNISLTDALKMFTINAAYSVNAESTKGSIEIGKDADFTVLSSNPYDYEDSDELFSINPCMTIVGGKTIYSAE